MRIIECENKYLEYDKNGYHSRMYTNIKKSGNKIYLSLINNIKGN